VSEAVLKLQPELFAHLVPPAQDPGPAGHLPYLTDEEYAQSIEACLNEAPDRSNIWIFAYGSLIWKPCFSVTDRRIGVVRGWQRAFCLKTTRWRGTEARPGLMMALDRGGSCRGVAYRLNPETLMEDLNRLWRREIGVKPVNHDPRWVTVEEEGRSEIQAIAFTANPDGRSYVTGGSLDDVAATLAGAVGVWGSCAEYLYETARQLHALGIEDETVWTLQERVAERLQREVRTSR